MSKMSKMSKWYGIMMVVVVSVALSATSVFAADFNGNTDTSWADGSNWNTEEYPGGATATEHHGFIYGGLTCDLATNLPNLTQVQLSQATLNINSGGSANSPSGLALGERPASGDSIMTINSGASWTNHGLRFARHSGLTDKTGVSELHVNGGYYSQNHNFDLRSSGTGTTARIRVSGGTFEILSGRPWGDVGGTGTRNQELLLAGGTADFYDIYVTAQVSALMQVSGGDVSCENLQINTNGPNNRIEVSGTNASLTVDATMSVFGGTTVFAATAGGVSTFEVTTLDLEGATASERGALEVDLTSYDLDASGDVVELFSYTTFNGGAFSSTNITGVSSYELDYTYAGGTKVVLKNLRLPPDGTLFWQQ